MKSAAVPPMLQDETALEAFSYTLNDVISEFLVELEWREKLIKLVGRSIV
jgi:hypothetical protein